MISAELVGVDDVVDQLFKTKGSDFSLLGDQVAVGDYADRRVSPEAGERSLRVLVHTNIRAMVAIAGDQGIDERSIGANTKGAQNLIKYPAPVPLAE